MAFRYWLPLLANQEYSALIYAILSHFCVTLRHQPAQMLFLDNHYLNEMQVKREMYF